MSQEAASEHTATLSEAPPLNIYKDIKVGEVRCATGLNRENTSTTAVFSL